MKADFETGLAIGSLLGRGTTKIKPNITSLTVTENGTYTAPAGIDGYSPVNVGVPDRYTEGYNDGYNDGCDDTKDKYEKIIAQINGDMPPVEDDSGNVIENAIVTDDTDELSDLLEGVVFPSGGGSVTVQGLSGADVSLKIECHKSYNADGSVSSTGVRAIATNLLTGETYTDSGSMNFGGENITFKIIDVDTNTDRTYLDIKVQFYKNGEPITNSYGKQWVGAYAWNCGGTSFGTSDTQWAMTQGG